MKSSSVVKTSPFSSNTWKVICVGVTVFVGVVVFVGVTVMVGVTVFVGV